MERRRLTRVLSKFTKQELLDKCQQLSLPGGPGLRRQSKRQLIASLVDGCSEAKLSSSDILRLELSYAVDHCNSMLWRAYQLERLEPSHCSLVELDSQVFSKRLQVYLGDVCDFEMVDDLTTSGHCWLCLRLQNKSTQPYTCFILRSPAVPYLYLAGVRKAQLTPLLEALCLTLECANFVDLELSGRNLDSILEQTMNKYSQGPYAQYRLNQVDPNPLLAVAKRQSSFSSQSERTRPQCQEGERELAVNNVFGSNPLPKLEKFVFKLQAAVPDGSEPIQCKVKLSGRSVLEGVRESFLTGCATLPIPETFRCIPHRSSTVVSIIETSDTPTHSQVADHLTCPS